MAALHAALHEAMVGLATQDQQQLKRIFGQVMGEISVTLIDPAVSAFPELKVDEDTWAAVARARAAARASAA